MEHELRMFSGKRPRNGIVEIEGGESGKWRVPHGRKIHAASARVGGPLSGKGGSGTLVVLACAGVGLIGLSHWFSDGFAERLGLKQTEDTPITCRLCMALEAER